MYNDEPVPEIVHDYTLNASVQPRLLEPTKPQASIDKNVPGDWLVPSRGGKKWTAIVIHHSGTKNGSATVFDKWHREGKHWEGVGYHFVIGNGTNTGNGEVEATFRWRQQKVGAHCGGTAGNWANRDAVGICLVGDFNRTLPPSQQMRSLLKLIRFLQGRYKIPKNRVYGHNTTPGASATDCPGRSFSIAKLRAMLDF